MKYMYELIKQPSTWRGVVAIFTAFGIYFNPEQIEAIVSSGLAISGVIGAFFSDRFT
jgi:hypothetical protein